MALQPPEETPIECFAAWLNLPVTDPHYKLLCVKGTAGTGKTEFIREIVIFLNGLDVVCVAPTNKAAKVLRSRGVMANTIHRLCFAALPTGRTKEQLSPLLDPNTLKPIRDASGKILYKVEVEDIFEYEFDEDSIFKKAAQFSQLTHGQPLIIVIDEASMIQSKIWYHLLSTTNCRLIPVGDGNQLESVESEVEALERTIANLNIGLAERQEAFDILMLYHRPYLNYFQKYPADITLTKNHRQSAGSDIHPILDSILQNGTYPLPFNSADVTTMDLGYHKKTLPDVIEEIASHDIVLAHMNKTVDLLNTLIRNFRNKGSKTSSGLTDHALPVINDRLYVTKMHKLGISKSVICKGDTLIITADPALDLDNGTAIIDVDSDDGNSYQGLTLDLGFAGYPKQRTKPAISALTAVYAYALTVHKSQGSQFDSVCVIDERLPYNRKSWLYTACSRAQTVLTVFTGFSSFPKQNERRRRD